MGLSSYGKNTDLVNKLNKLISITSGELLITTDSLGALSNKLSIADLGFDVIYSLCDPLIIPKIKMYNDPEVWEMELELSPDDISNLIKAKNALSDYNYFTINASKDADGILLSEFTFGDGNNYSNKIQYKIQGRIDDELLNDPIPFDSEIFKNILNSNKDMIKSSFKLSKKGMLKLEFESEDLTSIYYVARNEQQN